MPFDDEIVVLAIADRGLRSMWSARLGLAGEILLIVDSCDDPSLDPVMRATAMLITDTDVPDVSAREHVAAVRHLGWRSGVILLVARPDTDVADPLAAAMVRNAETEIVVALLRAWRTRRTQNALSCQLFE